MFISSTSRPRHSIIWTEASYILKMAIIKIFKNNRDIYYMQTRPRKKIELRFKLKDTIKELIAHVLNVLIHRGTLENTNKFHRSSQDSPQVFQESLSYSSDKYHFAPSIRFWELSTSSNKISSASIEFPSIFSIHFWNTKTKFLLLFNHISYDGASLNLFHFQECTSCPK